MTPPVRPGEIAVADLDPVVGHEQGGVRPVLIISRESYNRLRSQQVILVPITRTDRGLPFHVPIGTDAGLRTMSFAMADSVRAVSLRRLGQNLGSVPVDTLNAVREHVTRLLRD